MSDREVAEKIAQEFIHKHELRIGSGDPQYKALIGLITEALTTAKQELARKFIEAVKAEHLEEPVTGGPDAAYDIAIEHATEALKAVAKQEGIEIE
jgi:hypothetical protein